MGIAVVELQRKKPVCLANALLECPLDDLKVGFRDYLAAFVAEVETWVEEFSPDALILERFQARGLRGGTTSEVVSIMIGAITMHYIHLPTRLVTAATWKNPFQKKHGKLTEMYKQCPTPHQLDAALIGVYGLSTGLNIELEYNVPKFVLQIGKTSRTMK